LVFNWKPFWQNHVDSFIIEIMNARLWILAWFRIKLFPWLHESLSWLRFVFVRFLMNVLCVLHDLSVWSIFLQKILLFVLIFNFDFFFSLNLCLGLFFRWNLGFGSIHGWTSVFGLTNLVLFWVKYIRICLFGEPFVKDFFGLKGCLANTPLSPFW
jgi:hypothetical protein